MGASVDLSLVLVLGVNKIFWVLVFEVFVFFEA